MKQFYLPQELDYHHLRLCLDNFEVDSLYIRDCGEIHEDGKYPGWDKLTCVKILKKEN